MKILISAALAAGLTVAAAGAAQASPLGSAARDIGAPADIDVILVAQKNVKFSGSAKITPQGTVKSDGIKSGGVKSGGLGGNKGGGHWNGNRGGGYGTGLAVGLGVGIVGGMIAADQQQQFVEPDEGYDMGCPNGSYINRRGEERCRR